MRYLLAIAHIQLSPAICLPVVQRGDAWWAPAPAPAPAVQALLLVCMLWLPGFFGPPGAPGAVPAQKLCGNVPPLPGARHLAVLILHDLHVMAGTNT